MDSGIDNADSRTRGKVALNPKRILSSSTSRHLLPEIIIKNGLFALSLWITREWLFSQGVGVLWVLTRTLACGGLVVLMKDWFFGSLRKTNSLMSLSAEWPTILVSSAVLFVQYASLLTALVRLSPIRVIVFTQFGYACIKALSNAFTSQLLLLALSLALSFASEAHFSLQLIRETLPGYIALVSFAVSAAVLEHLHLLLSPKLGPHAPAAHSTLGAAVLALLLYPITKILSIAPSSPVVPLHALLALPLLSCALYFGTFSSSTRPRHIGASYLSTCLFTTGFGALLFSRYPSLMDVVIGSLLVGGLYLRSPPADELEKPPTSRTFRTYLKTVMENSESRRIFYFLVLNLSFMLVQMLYGIWTNSLGLISDAIHMGFDCMAIGVGLLASVMATWPPNEQFTYGFGRIETLSGFANGVFLVLISIFIIFEAIQRLLDPPEMNTNQLLLISSLGLGVNLFGMFAMGGHHHHGHSHGHHHHSHDHSHEGTDHSSHGHHHGSDCQHSDGTDSSTDYSGHDQGTMKAIPANGPPAHRHSRGPSLQIDAHMGSPGGCQLGIPKHLDSIGDMASPLTPNYRFGEDQHFANHQHAQHTPNLHDHSHVHSHSHEGHSHNMRGVFLHVMADTLGSVGVIISTLLIQFYGWTGFDPIASLFIAILIAASVIPLVIDTGRVLALDVSDRSASIHAALSELVTIEGLSSYSSPQFWPKDDTSLIGSVHVQLAVHSGMDLVVAHVDSLLRDRIPGLEELTIQVEESDH
ncbi:hypothetical protein EVG20_g690 [Dentipellis fragilis]|uniref:Cation efflux protein transmembrane domain-containing protein n=1 Tax=Dentipellis fragilis TaxID=205917 RepID=A0A4Y9ZEW7_9AGAM|nr:hypothetical protein EVG20_g690 [Dentipellis fragilis]